MSDAHISKTLRAKVAVQAQHRCGYCLTAEAIVGAPMEIDHLIPQSLGGPTTEDNLWLACSLCNDHNGNRIAALDPETGEVVRLFDPRRQVWHEHFRWSTAGDRITGRPGHWPRHRNGAQSEPGRTRQSAAGLGDGRLASPSILG